MGKSTKKKRNDGMQSIRLDEQDEAAPDAAAAGADEPLFPEESTAKKPKKKKKARKEAAAAEQAPAADAEVRAVDEAAAPAAESDSTKTAAPKTCELDEQSISKMLHEREGAKRDHDWETADRIRNEMQAAGVTLHDSRKQWVACDGREGRIAFAPLGFNSRGEKIKKNRKKTRSKLKGIKKDSRPPELRPGGAKYVGKATSAGSTAQVVWDPSRGHPGTPFGAGAPPGASTAGGSGGGGDRKASKEKRQKKRQKEAAEKEKEGGGKGSAKAPKREAAAAELAKPAKTSAAVPKTPKERRRAMLMAHIQETGTVV